MSVKDVTWLRKSGRLDEAYELACQELDEDENMWTRMSMFWVLRDYVQNVHIPNGDMVSARLCIYEMKDLLPHMMDDSGAGERAYQSLCRRVMPGAEEIRTLSDLSKSDPVGAYRKAMEKFPSAWVTLGEELHEDFGWMVYRYLKANGGKLSSEQVGVVLQGYMSLKNERPSLLHSMILIFALGYSKEHVDFDFLAFFRWWDSRNLRCEDWEKGRSEDGKEWPSLASRAIKKSFDCVKADEALRGDMELLEWLKGLCTSVMHYEPDDDWSSRRCAMISLWQGNRDEAIATYKSLLSNMGEKYYLWSELADCVPDDNALRIGLLLKAKAAEKNEDFIGDIHLSLASSWLKEGCAKEAEDELQTYVDHRRKMGWSIPNSYVELENAVSGASGKGAAADKDEYLRKADEFAYSEYEWHEYVLAEKWTHEGDERCNFFDGKNLSFSVKAKRFPILKKAKPGDVFRFKCKEEKYEFDGTVVTPLLVASSDSEPWSLMPVKYGVVDYVNEEKRVMHVVTHESQQVFCDCCTPDVRKDSYVRLRVYKNRRKDEMSAADVVPCPKEEALPNFRSRVVAVDDVNERKQLFHVVLGKGLVSDIVRFDQTDIRPGIGDFLRVTYCIRKNKEGKKRIKFLEISTTDEKNERLVREMSGLLELKYKDGRWGDEDGSDADFAFIGDCYVHRHVLWKYGISKDCYVDAKAVIGADGRWQVYELKAL